jgi:hypothetical protein
VHSVSRGLVILADRNWTPDNIKHLRSIVSWWRIILAQFGNYGIGKPLATREE